MDCSEEVSVLKTPPFYTTPASEDQREHGSGEEGTLLLCSEQSIHCSEIDHKATLQQSAPSTRPAYSNR
jgi:hypothetical protein